MFMLDPPAESEGIPAQPAHIATSIPTTMSFNMFFPRYSLTTTPISILARRRGTLGKGSGCINSSRFDETSCAASG
jgi:hypothetical protein